VCLLLLHRYAARARKRQVTLFAAPDLAAGLLRSHSPMRRRLKNFLLVAAIAAMGLALARPQLGRNTETSQALGEDIPVSARLLQKHARQRRCRRTASTRARYAILDFVQETRTRAASASWRFRAGFLAMSPDV